MERIQSTDERFDQLHKRILEDLECSYRLQRIELVESQGRARAQDIHVSIYSEGQERSQEAFHQIWYENLMAGQRQLHMVAQSTIDSNTASGAAVKRMIAQLGNVTITRSSIAQSPHEGNSLPANPRDSLSIHATPTTGDRTTPSVSLLDPSTEQLTHSITSRPTQLCSQSSEHKSKGSSAYHYTTVPGLRSITRPHVTHNTRTIPIEILRKGLGIGGEEHRETWLSILLWCKDNLPIYGITVNDTIPSLCANKRSSLEMFINEIEKVHPCLTRAQESWAAEAVLANFLYQARQQIKIKTNLDHKRASPSIFESPEPKRFWPRHVPQRLSLAGSLSPTSSPIADHDHTARHGDTEALERLRPLPAYINSRSYCHGPGVLSDRDSKEYLNHANDGGVGGLDNYRGHATDGPSPEPVGEGPPTRYTTEIFTPVLPDSGRSKLSSNKILAAAKLKQFGNGDVFGFWKDPSHHRPSALPTRDIDIRVNTTDRDSDQYMKPFISIDNLLRGNPTSTDNGIDPSENSELQTRRRGSLSAPPAPLLGYSRSFIAHTEINARKDTKQFEARRLSSAFSDRTEAGLRCNGKSTHHSQLQGETGGKWNGEVGCIEKIPTPLEPPHPEVMDNIGSHILAGTSLSGGIISKPLHKQSHEVPATFVAGSSASSPLEAQVPPATASPRSATSTDMINNPDSGQVDVNKNLQAISAGLRKSIPSWMTDSVDPFVAPSPLKDSPVRSIFDNLPKRTSTPKSFEPKVGLDGNIDYSAIFDTPIPFQSSGVNQFHAVELRRAFNFSESTSKGRLKVQSESGLETHETSCWSIENITKSVESAKSVVVRSSTSLENDIIEENRDYTPVIGLDDQIGFGKSATVKDISVLTNELGQGSVDRANLRGGSGLSIQETPLGNDCACNSTANTEEGNNEAGLPIASRPVYSHYSRSPKLQQNEDSNNDQKFTGNESATHHEGSPPYSDRDSRSSYIKGAIATTNVFSTAILNTLESQHDPVRAEGVSLQNFEQNYKPTDRGKNEEGGSSYQLSHHEVPVGEQQIQNRTSTGRFGADSAYLPTDVSIGEAFHRPPSGGSHGFQLRHHDNKGPSKITGSQKILTDKAGKVQKDRNTWLKRSAWNGERTHTTHDRPPRL